MLSKKVSNAVQSPGDKNLFLELYFPAKYECEEGKNTVESNLTWAFSDLALRCEDDGSVFKTEVDTPRNTAVC